mgnify:CR=1 FL=1
MLTIPVYNSQGKELEALSLPKKIFGLKVNPALLHLVTTVFLGNERKGTAKVKTRAERRGGGRKPYRQKGTDSARAGTTRSPIWRKGGRIFGPTGEQNYHRELPHKVKVKSLLMGLSAKAQSQQMIALESFKLDSISTKNLVELFKKLPLQRSVLVIMPTKDEKVILSARNVPTVTTRTYDNINTLDILEHDFVLLLKDALPLIEKKWSDYSFKGVLSDEEMQVTIEKAVQKKANIVQKEPVKKAPKAVKKSEKVMTKKAPTKKPRKGKSPKA